MKKKMSAIIAVLFVTEMLLLSSVSIALGSGSGTTSGDFLKINPDPEVTAMGEGATGLYSDLPTGMLSNPASLMGVTRAKVTLDDVVYFQGMNSYYTGFVLPLNYGNFGCGVNYFSYGAIDGYTTDLQKISLPDSYDMAVVFGYAIPIRTTLPVLKQYGSVGVNVKVVRSQLVDYSAECIAADFGGIYNVPFIDGLTFGMAYKNVGSGLKYVTETSNLPTSLDMGFAYTDYAKNNLSVVLDADMPDQGPQSFSVGMSITPVYFVTLRAGWKMTQDSLMSGIRAGFGLKFGSFNLDYAFSSAQDLGLVNYLSASFAVGSIFKPEEAFNYYLEEHFKTAIDYYYQHDYVLAKQEFETILAAYPEHELSIKYLSKVNDILAASKRREEDNINKIIKQANRAFAKKDYIFAQKLYSSVLQLDDENLKAKEGLRNIQDVVKDIQTDKVRHENAKRIEEMWIIGERYFKNGNFVAAKDKFKEILAIDPQHPEVNEYMTEIDNQIRKTDALEVNKMYDKGTEFYLKGNFDEAIKYFEAVLLSAPQRMDAKDFIDKCKDKIKMHEEKVKAEQIALDQSSKKKEISDAYTTAEKLYEKSKFEPALEAFIKAKEIADKYKFTDYLDKIENYVSMTKAALSETYYKDGFNFFQKNRFDEAVSAYRAALKYDPDNASAKVELERISNELAQKYYERGMTSFSEGDMDKAKKEFEKSLSYDPKMKESQRALERIK